MRTSKAKEFEIWKEAAEFAASFPDDEMSEEGLKTMLEYKDKLEACQKATA